MIFLAGFLLIYRIIHSPFGEVLKAIRENEPRAISLGYKTDRYKLLAFVLSATLAGLAGSTKAIVLQIASLTDVDWPMSGEVVLMALVGGLGTVFGPVAGAFIVVAMQNYLAQVGQWVTVIQGVIFVLCVLLFRRGVIGELAAPAAHQAVTSFQCQRRRGCRQPGMTSMSAEARLKELGLTLPNVPAPVANYLPYRVAGNLLFLAGQGPRDADGS